MYDFNVRRVNLWVRLKKKVLKRCRRKSLRVEAILNNTLMKAETLKIEATAVIPMMAASERGIV
jgi:hypothetical protein